MASPSPSPLYGAVLKIFGPAHAFHGLEMHDIAIGRYPVGDAWIPCGDLCGNDDDIEQWSVHGKTLLVGSSSGVSEYLRVGCLLL
jgi:hypothetical protein